MSLIYTKVTSLLFVILLLLSLYGCSKSNNSNEAVDIMLPGDDVILAKVGGDVISQYDLQLLMDTTLGSEQARMLDDPGRRKMLESMVLSHEFAKNIKSEMSPFELAAIDKKVKAYQEQLLVKEYMKRHIIPQPITQNMVKEFYDENPHKFGGVTVRKYELLVTVDKFSNKDRDAVVKLLQKAINVSDWVAYNNNINKDEKIIQYRRGDIDSNVLDSKLLHLLDALKTGQTSEVTFLNGKAYVARVTSENSFPPKPLNMVSQEIRKMLLPIQLKAAVKSVSDEVLKNADVEYVN